MPPHSLAVLRVKDARTLVVKEPSSPVVLLLQVEEALSTAQLRCLCVATPFAPVMAVGEIREWNPGARAFEGEITRVDVMPRQQAPAASRRDRASLLKRKRGGVVVIH